MLRLDDVTIARGTRVLYTHATAVAVPGERIALVGQNGCGKSSLFAAVLGELTPEDGSIEAPARDRIAHVAQTILETDEQSLQYVLSGHAPLMKAKKELADAQAGDDAMRLAAAMAELADLNEGAIRADAQTIMAGLGFLPQDATRLVRDFSGGWRNRLALARALMCPADLLLLDEPTNHLDLDSLIWLEEWLRHVRSTVVIISHDREFLDHAVQTTWAIEDGKLTTYSGNYSFYEQQRIERMRLQDAAARAYERQAAHLSAFIERFRYKATKARQAQSRLKMLSKLEAVEPVRARREWRFAFLEPERTPEHLIDTDRLCVGYDGKLVVSNVTLSIRAQERIGVLGVNGAGKSTLIKALAGTLRPLSGEIRRGQGLVVGYFAQHQVEQLDEDLTAIEEFKHKAPDVREQELRDFLGKFRFSGDLADQQVANMSGGEKARLALALIAWDKPNLLILDEPTNHLDMATREALAMALSTFAGSLLLVSHDRHLLRTTCDRLLLVHEGEVSEYEGDLDDYAQLVLAHRKAVQAAARSKQAEQTGQATVPAGVDRKEQRRIQALERARIAALKKPLQKKIEKLEKAMAQDNEQLKLLDHQLADTEWYSTAGEDAVAKALKDRGVLAARLEDYETQWLDLSEQLEKIQ